MEARRSGLSAARALLAVVVAVAGAFPLLPPRASAASPTVNVLQSVARSDFPRQLTFEVVAQSTAQIASVRLAYRVGDDPVTIEALATLTPGVRVTATR